MLGILILILVIFHLKGGLINLSSRSLGTFFSELDQKAIVNQYLGSLFSILICFYIRVTSLPRKGIFALI